MSENSLQNGAKYCIPRDSDRFGEPINEMGFMTINVIKKCLWDGHDKDEVMVVGAVG